MTPGCFIGLCTEVSLGADSDYVCQNTCRQRRADPSNGNVFENAEVNAKAEALPVEAPAESASAAPEAEVKAEEPKAVEAKEEAVCAVSADNAACSCVLTAESTSCTCVADTVKAEESCAFASNANASCGKCAYAQQTTADEAKTNA